MKIERITYKRVKNIGNYESETLELSAILDEEEGASVALVEESILGLKDLVRCYLDLNQENKQSPTIVDNSCDELNEIPF